jgi:hypothetical protein
MGSTRGVLPLHFFVVFLCFLFKGEENWKFSWILRYNSARGALPSANAEILTVIFWFKNIRAVYRTLLWFIVAVNFILIVELLVEICFAVIGFLIY